MRYLDEVEQEREDDVVTVIIAEFVAPKWWEKLLHNHSGLLLKLALLGKRGIVVTNVRYYLDEGTAAPAGVAAHPFAEPKSKEPGPAMQTGTIQRDG